jgi:hypothetical protein
LFPGASEHDAGQQCLVFAALHGLSEIRPGDALQMCLLLLAHLRGLLSKLAEGAESLAGSIDGDNACKFLTRRGSVDSS